MGDVVDFPLTRGELESVQALEDLLVEAKHGHIKGFAYITRGEGIEYAVGAAGTARQCPDSTQQLLLLLYTELNKIARSKP